MSNPFKAVFNAIGSVVSFVIDNALPIIETVAFDYFIAPGFGSLISSALDISSTIATQIASGIGHAAISAINGGSLASIAAAGLAPIISSPQIQEKVFGGSITGANGAINQAVGKVISDPTMSKIVSGALGQAGAAGLVAGITGGDILKAAGMAGLSSVVSQSLGKVWDSIKKATPTMDDLQKQYDALFKNNIAGNEQKIQGIANLEGSVQQTADQFNSQLDQYNSLKSEWDAQKALYDKAVAANDATTANKIADTLNNTIAPKIQALVPNLNATYDMYKTQSFTLNTTISQNQSLIDSVMQAHSLQNQYDLLSTQIMNDYNVYNLNNSLANGNYLDAAKYQADIFNLNNVMAGLDPKAIPTSTGLSTTQTELLKSINSATTQAAKDQFIAKAASDASFASLINKNPINLPTTDLTKIIPSETGTSTTPTTTTTTTTPTTPITPTTPAIAPTSMGAAHDVVYGQTPGYDTLPKLPDSGIGQPTPTIDTTPTTPTTPSISNAILPTAMGAAVTPTVGGFIDKLVNTTGNIIQQGTIGGIANEIIGGITGTTPSTPKPPPLPPKPPAHVNVSGLKPFTGTLPSNLAGTTTQTGTGGLPSGTTGTTPTSTTPPKKVDVSTLKPITDTAYLKSLGIV